MHKTNKQSGEELLGLPLNLFLPPLLKAFPHFPEVQSSPREQFGSHQPKPTYSFYELGLTSLVVKWCCVLP